MKLWKKWLTTIVASLSLCIAPAAMASAASTAQILLYGAATMVLAKQQLPQMDNNNQKQMLANTQAKTGVVNNEAYSDRLENIQRNLVATGLIKRNYDVYANPSTDLNAFETIGGVISVNKGMLDALNDDELALRCAMKCSTVKNAMPSTASSRVSVFQRSSTCPSAAMPMSWTSSWAV